MWGVATPEESNEHNWSTPNGGASNKVSVILMLSNDFLYKFYIDDFYDINFQSKGNW
jgi:hypothetical protein